MNPYLQQASTRRFWSWKSKLLFVLLVISAFRIAGADPVTCSSPNPAPTNSSLLSTSDEDPAYDMEPKRQRGVQRRTKIVQHAIVLTWWSKWKRRTVGGSASSSVDGPSCGRRHQNHTLRWRRWPQQELRSMRMSEKKTKQLGVRNQSAAIFYNS